MQRYVPIKTFGTGPYFPFLPKFCFMQRYVPIKTKEKAKADFVG